MISKRSLTPILAVAVLALALLPLRALAANLLNTTVPISFSVFDSCTSETLAVSGTEHETINETFPSSGGVHLDIHLNIQATATGLISGNSYVVNATANLTANVNPGGTFTVTEPISIELVSKGSAPNQKIKVLLHITINPDGTTTSFIDTFSVDCTG